MRLRLHPEAEAETRAAYDYYEGQRNGLGAEFAAALDIALEAIEMTPLVWRAFAHDCRRRLLSRFPFGVVYQIERDEIVVYAVMHLRREPDYWVNRLP